MQRGKKSVIRFEFVYLHLMSVLFQCTELGLVRGYLTLRMLSWDPWVPLGSGRGAFVVRTAARREMIAICRAALTDGQVMRTPHRTPRPIIRSHHYSVNWLEVFDCLVPREWNAADDLVRGCKVCSEEEKWRIAASTVKHWPEGDIELIRHIVPIHNPFTCITHKTAHIKQ